jgi:hypothetical protein
MHESSSLFLGSEPEGDTRGAFRKQGRTSTTYSGKDGNHSGDRSGLYRGKESRHVSETGGENGGHPQIQNCVVATVGMTTDEIMALENEGVFSNIIRHLPR